MQCRIQFVREKPDGDAEPYLIDALIGSFRSLHEAALQAERRIKQAAGQGDVIASYMIVDANDVPVDPLGRPLK